MSYRSLEKVSLAFQCRWKKYSHYIAVTRELKIPSSQIHARMNLYFRTDLNPHNNILLFFARDNAADIDEIPVMSI